MSRSYAKRYRRCKLDTAYKRIASRFVRHKLKREVYSDMESTGRLPYKKMYQSMLICDSSLKIIPKTTEENSWWTIKARRK